MPFTWNSESNIPPRELPQPVPPGEVSYEVAEVANTVNVNGYLSYNTANHGYDVLYPVESFSPNSSANFSLANIGNAHFGIANLKQAYINTANIGNATITFGYVTGDPTSNLGIADKQYVDNAVAALSLLVGPDASVNIFTNVGDLLVGVSANTGARLGVGANGQVLTVNTSAALKQSWTAMSASQLVSGLSIGTHYHPTLKYSQVLLKHADGIVMDDGTATTGWDGLTADITVSGAGGLDQGSESANAWYEVWAIRTPAGSQALLLHRTLNRMIDQAWQPTSITLIAGLRYDAFTTTLPFQRYCTKVSQSFVPAISGPLSAVELQSYTTTGTPLGNVWVSIQTDDGTGNASGSPLATAVAFEANYLSASTTVLHFIFNTPPTVASGSRYHIVAEGDWPFSRLSTATGNTVFFAGNTAPLGPGQQNWMANVGYTSGNLTINSGYGDSRMYNVVTSSWATTANLGGPQDLWFDTYVEQNLTPLVLPPGYTQKALISYVRNNGSSNFKEYHQFNRTMMMGYDTDWKVWESGSTQTIVSIDLETCVPPVACGLQFLNYCNNASFATFYGFKFGDTHMTDLDIQTYIATNSHGKFPYGPSEGRIGLGPIMAHDGSQFLFSYQLATNYHSYVASITI